MGVGTTPPNVMEPINEGGGSGSGAGLERQAVPPAPLSTAAAPEADADAEPASDAYDDEMLDGLADVSFPLGRFDDAEDDDPESGGEGGGSGNGGGNAAASHAPTLQGGWDDGAIASCFKIALGTHDLGPAELERAAGWEAGPPMVPARFRTAEARAMGGGGSDRGAQGAEGAGGESLDGRAGGARWKPKPLSLPEWAVDPAFAAAKLSS